jgi:hypothetical protein
MMLELSRLKQESLEKIKESSKRLEIPEEMRGAPKPGSIPPWERTSGIREELIKSVKPDAADQTEKEQEKKPKLTEDEKTKIKEEHPDWPDEIIDAIGSWEEYQVYDKAGLQYVEINGKPCLIRSDIDMNQKDEFGRTNKERMEQGLAPLDKNGKPIELHHIGQKPDSPLAELTQEEHRGHGNDSILHDKTKPTEIDRGEFQKEKEGHWETRAGQS